MVSSLKADRSANLGQRPLRQMIWVKAANDNSRETSPLSRCGSNAAKKLAVGSAQYPLALAAVAAGAGDDGLGRTLPGPAAKSPNPGTNAQHPGSDPRVAVGDGPARRCDPLYRSAADRSFDQDQSGSRSCGLGVCPSKRMVP